MTEVLAEPLDARRRDAALWLTLNRPEALNGLSPELIAALDAGLDTAAGDPDVAAVVIAGAGHVFCAGADLKFVGGLIEETPDQAAARLRAFLEVDGRVFNRIESSPKPVIAAVDGLAVAGGLELLLTCDFVIATQNARFGDAHANYGLLPGGGGSVRLPRRVGPGLAKYLMFTGRSLSAVELAHTDLITVLVHDGEQLQDVVDGVVADIARTTPRGIETMKELVHSTLRPAPQADLAAELDVVERYAAADDFAEGLRAFAKKRRPRFRER